MKDSTLIQEEDSAEEDTKDNHTKEYMGLFKDIDLEGNEGYAVYFSDGKDTLVCGMHTNDKESAEWVLNKLVCLYWVKKSNQKNVVEDADYDDGLCASIRSVISKYYQRKDFEERL